MPSMNGSLLCLGEARCHALFCCLCRERGLGQWPETSQLAPNSGINPGNAKCGSPNPHTHLLWTTRAPWRAHTTDGAPPPRRAHWWPCQSGRQGRLAQRRRLPLLLPGTAATLAAKTTWGWRGVQTLKPATQERRPWWALHLLLASLGALPLLRSRLGRVAWGRASARLPMRS